MLSSSFVLAITESMAIIVLLIMLVQDWRWRGIQWPLFPLLASLLLISHFTINPAAVVLTDAAINSMLVGLQVLLLAAYVRLRFRASLLHYLGVGDILYWLACAMYFSPTVFLSYHLVSLLIALCGHLLFSRFYLAPRSARIPLAGFQAACLVLVILLFWVAPAYRPFSDDALLSYFY